MKATPLLAAFVRRVLLLPLLLLVAALSARAAVIIDSAFGTVGEEMRLTVRLSDTALLSATVSLTAVLRLGNETMFYPERLIAPSGGRLIRADLTRIDDWRWRIDALVERGPLAGDSLLQIAGEALAGYDSVGTVLLEEISLQGVPQSEASARIFTEAVGTPRRYVRFARLEQGYPNPAARGEVITWTYQIDKSSEVRFEIYSITGRRLIVHDFGVVPAGRHQEKLVIGYDVPSAPYFARLITNSGEAIQFFHVLK